MNSTKNSNLFLKELTFRWTIISLLTCFISMELSSLSSWNSSYFTKIALVGFQYEPVSLDVNEVCAEEEQNILNTREKSRKSQGVTGWRRCEKWGVMHTNVENLSCGEVEAFGYFQLLDMKYDERNVVTEWVSTTVLQLYLIWTPAHILEHLIVPETDLRLPRLLRRSSLLH